MVENINKPEDEILKNWKGQPVVLFAENHLLADFTLPLAIATAERLNKPVGLEMLMPAHSVLINELRRGEITRAQFVNELAPYSPSASPALSPQEYLGIHRTRTMMDMIGSAIERGVEFHSLGTRLGFPAITTPEMAEIVDRVELLVTQIDHNSRQFLRQEGRQIDADQEDYYKTFKAQIMAQYDALTPEQKARLLQIETDRENQTSPKDDRNSIRKMQEMMQPEWMELERVGNTLPSRPAQDKNDPQATESERIDIRLANDERLGRKIGDIATANKKGMVVVYGALHTLHSNPAGGDIDGTLRKMGIPTLIVDPAIDGPIPCDWARICGSDKNQRQAQTLYERHLEETGIAKEENDPSRITVRLKPEARLGPQ